MEKDENRPQCSECNAPLPLAPGDYFEIDLVNGIYLSVRVDERVGEHLAFERLTFPGRQSRPDFEKNYLLRELEGAINWLVLQLRDEATDHEPTTDDVEFALLNSEFAIRERLQIWPRERGGYKPNNWPDHRLIKFLEYYEAMKELVDDMIDRCRAADVLEVRLATLNSTNQALPKNKRLPAYLIQAIAERPDQKKGITARDLALKGAAVAVGAITPEQLVTNYLPKLLTRARKLRSGMSALPKSLAASN